MLEPLARSAHRPALVVTRPDRPRGRGRRVSAPPVADAARALDLAVVQPDSVNSEAARAAIAAVAPEAIVVCAYGGLIAEPLLSDYEIFNVHPSLLPRWRGAAPIERAIEAGDAETGVSIMRPVAELDAGPVCASAPEPIAPDDDFGSLSARLERLAANLLLRALDERPPWRPQHAQGATYADKVTAADRRLDPALSPVALERRVRALSPHVGAYAEPATGERLGVVRARALPTSAAEGVAPDSGELVATGGRLLFGCAGGALELLVVKPAGGRAMEASAYLRGHGSRAGLPPREPPQSSA